MAINQIETICDLVQGFNFRKDVQSQIGMVKKLKIGEMELSADFTLKDPESNQKDMKAVGVLSYAGWSVSPTDPVNISLQLSETAKNKIDTLTKKSLSNIEVEMEFDCYNYDTSKKKYFKNFHTNEAEIKGLIMGQGNDLAIRIELSPNPVVQEPQNYTLNLSVKPQSKAQNLHYLSSVDDKLVLAWGISQG
jgi:hypothetical protein